MIMSIFKKKYKIKTVLPLVGFEPKYTSIDSAP